MSDEISLFGLTGRKVLIIGGGQGMGEAAAGFVARASADVALVDIVAEHGRRPWQRWLPRMEGAALMPWSPSSAPPLRRFKPWLVGRVL